MKALRIIGVPIDLGQDQRGVDMGPSAIRYAGLAMALQSLGYQIHDSGNLYVPVRNCLQEDCTSPFTEAIRHVCQAVYDTARQTLQQGAIPLFLGGDHSLAIGSIAGVAKDRKLGVIWVDAHADANTPATSPSGNIHGMPVATLLGHGLPELVNIGSPGAKLQGEDVVMIGIRDLDPGEREWLKTSGIKVYTMRDIDERGMGAVAREALAWLHDRSHLHISFDMDSLDPKDAPGVGTPCPGGLSYREAQLLMEIISDSGKVGSADFVEINPILDLGNRTAQLAVKLVESLFGKSIL